MFRNQVKTALRHLRRTPLYSAINFLGLGIGLAFVILIYLFIRHELSFDAFFENKENIYRVNEVEYTQSGVEEERDWLGYLKRTEGIRKWPYLPLRLGEALKDEIPEIRAYTRYDDGGGIVQRDNQVSAEDLRYVDANFFEVFSFPLIEGDPATVLDEKNDVVVTPAFAKKYFGRENPIGQALNITTEDSTQVFTVSGIAEAPPANSSLDFELLLRVENDPYYQHNYERWTSFNTPLFLELTEGADPQVVETKMQAFAERQFAEFADNLRTRNDLKKSDKAFELTITPLTGIHLDNSVSWPKQGSATNILILGGIALLILVIACLNYISLSLTTASGRMKEVAMRKVLGSTPQQIARQFWLEAQVLVLGALIFAIALVELFLPVFNDFIQRDLNFGWQQYLALGLPLLGIAFLTGLLSGSYPAAMLSRFRPVNILKSGGTYRYQPAFIKGAVVVQFSLSVFLIISSIIMARQMRYVNNKDLGYNGDQIVVMDPYTGWSDEGERLMRRLEEELQTDPDIEMISSTSGAFNRGWDNNGFETPDGEFHRAYVYRVDEDYLDILDIDLVAGRDFSTDHPTDATEGIIVNEALLRDLGIEGDPIGHEVPWRESQNRKIIGVVENYHFLSLTEEIKPVILHANPELGKVMNYMVKIDGQDIPGTLATLERSWSEIAPGKPFDYAFLDEDVARQYENYRRWTSIMQASSVFAVFIACLGLFGLAGILSVNKTKEIGIRKVLGAGVSDILLLLNRDLFRLALIALLIATPAAWYVMQQYLQNFEYRINLGWTSFLLAGVLLLTIALLTVSYHSARAALRNPVSALRYE